MKAAGGAVLLAGLAWLPACRGGAVPLLQPGAPGTDTRPIASEQATDLSKVGFTAADVRFMQGMIGHHAQAIEMVALVATRSASDDLKKLALRIDLSQADEIGMMRRWLTDRGQKLPDPHAHHHPGGLMPGMLTAEDMARLAAASGPDFDRLFLAGMIRHHEGAVTMVQDLYATGGGAGQESDIYAFASDVDADQRMEIQRMRGMLSARSAAGSPDH